MNKNALDYNDPALPSRDEIKQALLARLSEVLSHLFPNGKTLKREFQVGSLHGEQGQSLKVTLQGDKAGLWHDFERGSGGDIFDLWAAVYGFDTKREFSKILCSAAEWLGLAQLSKNPPQSTRQKKWVYTDPTGAPLVTIKRTDKAGGKKTFLPFDHISGKHGMPDLRPLYNLPSIMKSDHVIIVEGEKCAQTLIDLGYPATTVMGGANFSPDKTDFKPLAGKDILIWPDHDKAGQKYSQTLQDSLQAVKIKSLSVLCPPADKPEKWDAADAVMEGLEIKSFLDETLKTKIPIQRYEAFSLADLINDKSPMPEDLISPRLLTPSGILVIGGAPKSGKSDFTLSLLTHMAAGEGFLKFKPPRPLRVFVMQAEIQYDYLRERLQNMGLSEEAIKKAGNNIHITPQLKLLLNDEGVEIIKALICEKFPDAPPDVIVIDPIRNVFDGGPDFGNLGENDNNAMLFFLQKRIEILRDAVNPKAGVILVHHTKKISKSMFKEDPFQALSGASSLRSYYTSGMLIFRPDEEAAHRSLHFELRNGPGIQNMIVSKDKGRWVESDLNAVALVNQNYSQKLENERRRRKDVILQILYEEAEKGFLYTTNQFALNFEGKSGLGSHSSIYNRVNVLATKGDIKFFNDVHPTTKQRTQGSDRGYLCVPDMRLGPIKEGQDEKTGEVVEEFTPIKPTHYKDKQNGAMLPVENLDHWVHLDDEEAATCALKTIEN